ncbi:hypothetical protein [Methanolobus profundi]|uniref:hypothetical protein n=1 Tax=Methanolobus profundi TaxID=487685 RepID=UPI001160E0F1|nr:hypothetical protein [Methanolobus profundi]
MSFQELYTLNEPHCAVRKGIDDGIIILERFDSYHKLSDELAFQADKDNIGLKGSVKRGRLVKKEMSKDICLSML